MPVVNREVVLPCDRERAWELITDPSELEGWLADEVEFEAARGRAAADRRTARASSKRSPRASGSCSAGATAAWSGR